MKGGDRRAVSVEMVIGCMLILLTHSSFGVEHSKTHLAEVVFADAFPGSDIGQRVNNAIASCGPVRIAQCEIRLPAGSFELRTTISVFSPGISIVGAGISGTVLNYSGNTDGLLIRTNTVKPAGQFSGFTIRGNPHASGTAIEVIDTIGAKFEDISIFAFDQPHSVGMRFYAEELWVERTLVSHVSIEYSTTAVEFKTRTEGASFGYNRFVDLAVTLSTGQSGVDAKGGTFYNGTFTMTCNINQKAVVVAGCIVIGEGANWNNNVYQVNGEGPESPVLVGVHVKKGGHLSGFGLINIIFTDMQNDNPASYWPSFRVLPTALSSVLDGGSILNLDGSGEIDTVNPQLGTVGGYSDFGFVKGKDVLSPYVAMLGKASNSFMIYSFKADAAPNELTPLARFDTSGNLYVTGSVFAANAAFAELVRSRPDVRNYEVGDVLAISPETDGQFELSSTKYSTRVAGVYARKAGLTVGGHGLSGIPVRNEVSLVTQGIASCKVISANGPISPGDLLVSSGTSGYAMKGTRRDAMFGAVIGKSLGTLKAGKGLVPILVTLQ